jgi:hypothetical protein
MRMVLILLKKVVPNDFARDMPLPGVILPRSQACICPDIYLILNAFFAEIKWGFNPGGCPCAQQVGRYFRVQ